MKVYHDKDGKLYTYDKDGNVEWLFEVMIGQGDNVAKIVNNLLERSDNSGYAVTPTASPKLPSLDELFGEFLNEYDVVEYRNGIIDAYNYIKEKLDNFA